VLPAGNEGMLLDRRKQSIVTMATEPGECRRRSHTDQLRRQNTLVTRDVRNVVAFEATYTPVPRNL
jgi:hypothetical protein